MLFGLVPLSAQTSDFSDPQGEQLAGQLLEAHISQNPQMYRQLFFQNPQLTKRAFICAWVYAETQELEWMELQSLKNFIATLAADINSQYQDPGPQQVVNMYLQGNPNYGQALLSYAEQVYQGSATAQTSTSQPQSSGEQDPDKYGTVTVRAKDFPPQIAEILRPFFTKLARLTLAIAYSDAELLLQEIDTYPVVAKQFEQAVVSGGGQVTGELREMLDENQRQVELAKIDSMAEFGLIQEFDARTAELVAREEMVSNKLAIAFTGFRMGLRQQQDDKAGQYLQVAKQLLASEPDKVTPVHRYIVKTEEFQYRLARGESPSVHDTLSAFQIAWGELSGYQPLQSITADSAWYYGRFCNRFWIDQLVALNHPQGYSLVEDMVTQQIGWFQNTAKYYGLSPEYKGLDTLLRYNEVQSLLTTMLGVIDSVVYVVEQDPQAFQQASGNVDTSLSGLDDAIQLFEKFDKLMEMNLDRGGSGFPPYDLSRSAFVRELRTRRKLLSAQDIRKSKQQTVQALRGLMPDLEALSSPESYIEHHLRLGKTFQQLGDSDMAIIAWKRAQQKAENLGFLTRSIEASALLAEEYGRKDDWSSAGVFASKANDGMKEEVGDLDPEANMAMAKKSTEMAAMEAKAHIKANNPEEALRVLAQGKQMKVAAVELASNKKAAKATVQLKKKKRQVAKLAAKVKQLEAMPSSKTRDELLGKAQKLLADSRAEFLLQSRNLREKFSGLYSRALKFDPLKLPTMQKALPPGVGVVQYFATPDTLYIFLVTNEQFKLRSVAQSSADLDNEVIRFIRQIRRPTNSKDPKLESMAMGLYKVLLSPVEEDLKDCSTVVFIPSGKLDVLPFGALVDGGGKLVVEEKAILQLANPLDFIQLGTRQKKPIKKMVAFANATLDLPAAEKEGKDIAKLFPGSKVFARDEATRDNLMKFGSQGDALHLATHGVSNPTHPTKNYLKLSKGQKLDQEEILKLQLENTSVVTLSACDTALADDKDLDHNASLAEAFWIAGSPSVVATLWQVDDNSTGLLMTKFYEHLKTGTPKAEALRLAQNEVRQNPKYEHPYFWSGFVFFGDYR